MKNQSSSVQSVEFWEETIKSRSAVLVAIGASETVGSTSSHKGSETSARLFSSGRRFGRYAVLFFAWIFRASLIRQVGPGRRSLDRHEFESVEGRRGGFGNVF